MASFTASEEFKSIYGSSPTNNQIVETYYMNVLGRAAGPADVAYWVGEMDKGRTADGVLAFFANSDDNITRTAAALSDGVKLDPSYFLVA